MSEQIPIEQFNEAMLDGKLTTLELVRLAKLTTCVQLSEVVIDKIAEVEESEDYLSRESKVEAMSEILFAINENQKAIARISVVDGSFVYSEPNSEIERGDSPELREARRKVESAFSKVRSLGGREMYSTTGRRSSQLGTTSLVILPYRSQ